MDTHLGGYAQGGSVFISSAFRDMHAERERVILPGLPA